MPVSPVIAVFDVDGTLLAGDCLRMAAVRSRSRLGLMRAALVLLPWLLAWQLRRISTGEFKEKTLALFRICDRVNRAEASGNRNWLLPVLLQRVRPDALQRLRMHQEKGDRVVLCSASPRMLLAPLADVLGVELIATELQNQDGRWYPRLAGPNCKGPEKVKRLATHLGPLDDCTIEAYGDSKGDRELLRAAAFPHYRSFGPQPKPYPAFSLLPLLPVVALSLLSYGALGIWSQGHQLLPVLRTLWRPIGLGLVLVLLSYAIRFSRWRFLLGAIHQPLPRMGVDARIWMGSYAFTATPGKAGEALRSLLLQQECQVPVSPSLIALVVERLTDGLAVLLLVLIHLPLLIRLRTSLVVPLFVGVGLLTGMWVLGRSPALGGLLKQGIRRVLPPQLAGSGKEAWNALNHLLQPRPLLLATLIGTVAWSLEGLSLWILLQAMGMKAVSFGGATIAHTAAGLFGALTLLPGGLGSTEAGTVGLLMVQGIPLATATTATLLIRLMTLWFATGLGACCLLWSGSKKVKAPTSSLD